MAIKTKEELFGDGAGFGAAVPYSVANPPGHGAGNRGVAFGENLTSAIANRTHYALALNDEDLNDRIVPFETDGLDSAYRLGAAAVAGGGRVITLDGAAVETQSALATLYANDPANAHFRANALGDTSGGSVGYDFVSARGGGASYDAAAGIMDRRVFRADTGGGSFSEDEPIQLNPAGAGATLVRLTTGGQVFHTSGDSPIKLQFDLIEIAGGTDTDGLYVINTFGAADTDVSVRRLDGTSPSFTNTDVGTASVYRTKLASYGGYSARGGSALHGVVIAGYSDEGTSGTAALSVLAGPSSMLDPEDRVPLRALQFYYGDPTTTGTARAGGYFNAYGQFNFGIQNDELDGQDLLYRGAYASRVQKGTGVVGVSEVAHVVETIGGNTQTQSFDFLSMRSLEGTPYSATVSFDFTANSDTTGELSLTAGVTGTWDDLMPWGACIAEILTSPSSTNNGLYLVRHGTSASGFVYLRTLQGGTTSAFPGAGNSGTLRFHSFVSLGYRRAVPILSPAGASTTTNPSLVVPVREETLSSGILISGSSYSTDRAALSVVDSTPHLTDPAASVTSYITVAGVVAGSEFTYAAPPTNTRQIPLSSGQADSTGWEYNAIAGNASSWVSTASNAVLCFDFTIPFGATLTDVWVLTDPGGGGRTEGIRMNVRRVTTTFAAALPAEDDCFTPYVGNMDEDDDTGNVQTLRVTPNQNNVNDNVNYTWKVELLSGDAHSTDDIYGVRIEFTDPGPRNH